eukprot:TRINITY_DN8506_c0_g1_i1.p1 TRINITY_DN8506_c0_g1~~TRINITY_DN8506_c0_g1_i1.p1  ORF type:complete len:2004 (+),score=300.97 TRINITY_DN8506_c0_g1_i1:124-6135(+)
MLQRRLLHFVLKRMLGPYVKQELELEQVERMSVLNGNFELRSLELNEGVINPKFLQNTPFEMSSGYVSRLGIQLPAWKASKESIRLQIHGAEFKLCWRAASSEEEKHVWEECQSEADQREAEDLKRSLHEELDVDEDGSWSMFAAKGLDAIGSLINEVVQKVHVSMRDVTIHVRFPRRGNPDHYTTALLHVATVEFRDETTEPMVSPPTGAQGGSMAWLPSTYTKALHFSGLSVQLFEDTGNNLFGSCCSTDSDTARAAAEDEPRHATYELNPANYVICTEPTATHKVRINIRHDARDTGGCFLFDAEAILLPVTAILAPVHLELARHVIEAISAPTAAAPMPAAAQPPSTEPGAPTRLRLLVRSARLYLLYEDAPLGKLWETYLGRSTQGHVASSLDCPELPGHVLLELRNLVLENVTNVPLRDQALGDTTSLSVILNACERLPTQGRFTETNFFRAVNRDSEGSSGVDRSLNIQWVSDSWLPQEGEHGAINCRCVQTATLSRIAMDLHCECLSRVVGCLAKWAEGLSGESGSKPPQGTLADSALGTVTVSKEIVVAVPDVDLCFTFPLTHARPLATQWILPEEGPLPHQLRVRVSQLRAKTRTSILYTDAGVPCCSTTTPTQWDADFVSLNASVIHLPAGQEDVVACAEDGGTLQLILAKEGSPLPPELALVTGGLTEEAEVERESAAFSRAATALAVQLPQVRLALTKPNYYLIQWMFQQVAAALSQSSSLAAKEATTASTGEFPFETETEDQDIDSLPLRGSEAAEASDEPISFALMLSIGETNLRARAPRGVAAADPPVTTGAQPAPAPTSPGSPPRRQGVPMASVMAPSFSSAVGSAMFHSTHSSPDAWQPPEEAYDVMLEECENDFAEASVMLRSPTPLENEPSTGRRPVPPPPPPTALPPTSEHVYCAVFRELNVFLALYGKATPVTHSIVRIPAFEVSEKCLTSPEELAPLLRSFDRPSNKRSEAAIRCTKRIREVPALLREETSVNVVLNCPLLNHYATAAAADHWLFRVLEFLDPAVPDAAVKQAASRQSRGALSEEDDEEASPASELALEEDNVSRSTDVQLKVNDFNIVFDPIDLCGSSVLLGNSLTLATTTIAGATIGRLDIGLTDAQILVHDVFDEDLLEYMARNNIRPRYGCTSFGIQTELELLGFVQVAVLSNVDVVIRTNQQPKGRDKPVVVEISNATASVAACVDSFHTFLDHLQYFIDGRDLLYLAWSGKANATQSSDEPSSKVPMAALTASGGDATSLIHNAMSTPISLYGNDSPLHGSGRPGSPVVIDNPRSSAGQAAAMPSTLGKSLEDRKMDAAATRGGWHGTAPSVMDYWVGNAEYDFGEAAPSTGVRLLAPTAHVEPEDTSPLVVDQFHDVQLYDLGAAPQAAPRSETAVRFLPPGDGDDMVDVFMADEDTFSATELGVRTSSHGGPEGQSTLLNAWSQRRVMENYYAAPDIQALRGHVLPTELPTDLPVPVVELIVANLSVTAKLFGGLDFGKQSGKMAPPRRRRHPEENITDSTEQGADSAATEYGRSESPAQTAGAAPTVVSNTPDARARTFGFPLVVTHENYDPDNDTAENNLYCARGSRDARQLVELEVSDLFAQVDTFGEHEGFASRLVVSVGNLQVIDKHQQSTRHMMFGPRPDEPSGPGRRLLTITLHTVRPDPIAQPQCLEQRMAVEVLPLRVNVDQDTAEFLVAFLGRQYLPVFLPSPGAATRQPVILTPARRKYAERPLPGSGPMYFQRFSISALSAKIDYKPKHVDYRELKQGNVLQALNFCTLAGSELRLPMAEVTGCLGFDQVGQKLLQQWIPVLSKTEFLIFLCGIQPIRTVANLGSGLSGLVLVPLRQYRSDRRLLWGIQRGLSDFARTVTVEAADLTANVSAGTQTVLERAGAILGGRQPAAQRSKYADQPATAYEGLLAAYSSLSRGFQTAANAVLHIPVMAEESREGYVRTILRAVPLVMISPVIGTLEAVSKAALGFRNSVEPQHKAESDKLYKSRQ